MIEFVLTKGIRIKLDVRSTMLAAIAVEVRRRSDWTSIVSEKEYRRCECRGEKAEESQIIDYRFHFPS